MSSRPSGNRLLKPKWEAMEAREMKEKPGKEKDLGSGKISASIHLLVTMVIVKRKNGH